jgi:branched-subunit amino acid transport protein
MSIWLVMLLGGALTYLTRLSFIALQDKISMPTLMQRALRFVPPAVLSVVIFQELFYRNSALDLSLANSRSLAGIIAVVVAWRSRSPLLTIAFGMVSLLLLNLLFSFLGI